VKRQKVCLTLSTDEWRLLRRAVPYLRHRAMDADLPTGAIDSLLIRIMK